MTSPSPALGSLFTLQELAEYPLEWAVIGIVEADGAETGRRLVVPADTNPATGSADLFLPPGTDCGPLSLRCGFATWLALDFLAGRCPTGFLSAECVADAAQLARELSRPGFAAPPLAVEIDRDPEYRDWIAETVAPAQQALVAVHDVWERRAALKLQAPTRPLTIAPGLATDAPRSDAAEPSHHAAADADDAFAGADDAATPASDARQAAALSGHAAYRDHALRSWRWRRLATAALLILALGLGWQVGVLHHQLDQPRQPQLGIPSVDVMFDGPTRGGSTAEEQTQRVAMPAAADSLLVTVVIGAGLEPLESHATGRIDLEDDGGHLLWHSEPVDLTPAAELRLLLPQTLLPAGAYRLVLRRASAGDTAPPLAVRRLEITPGAAAPRPAR